MSSYQPRIAMIAAMANNRIIGADNDMPWHLPADLKHFKSVTLGKPVIMGRKTYESIGKALPGRHNIVISMQTQYQLDDADVVHSVAEALHLAKETQFKSAQPASEIMIIGGGKLYKAMLPAAQRLYLTFIDLNVAGDTEFPDYNLHANWHQVSSQPHTADEKNPYNYTFVCLDRVSDS